MTPEEQAAATHAPEAAPARFGDTSAYEDVISPEDMKALNLRRRAYMQLANDPRVEPRDREQAKQKYTAVAKILASQRPTSVKPDIETQGETFTRHFADAATFGGAGAIGRKIARTVPGYTEPTGPGLATPEQAQQESEQASDASNRAAAVGGELTGSVLPYGGPGLVFRGAGKVVGAAGRALGGGPSTIPLLNIGGGMLKGAATAGIASPVVAGARAGFEGQSIADAVKREVTSPLPYLAGGAFGAVEGMAGAIRSGSGQTGRDIRTVEDVGKGQVTPFGGAKKGYFESPVLKGMHTDEDVGVVAKRAGQSVLGKLNKRFADAGQSYAAAKGDAAASGALARNIDVKPLLDQAEQLMQSDRFTNATKKAIHAEVVAPLEARLGQGMRLEDFNDFKGKIADLSKVGTSTESTFQTRAFGDLANTARTMRGNTALGEVDREYAAAMEPLEETHEAMGFRPGTTHTEPGLIRDEEKAANFIMRRGQDTVTAGKQNDNERLILERFPELRQELQAPEMLRAKQRLSLGLHGGGLHRHVLPVLTRNAEPLTAGFYRVARKAPFLLPIIPPLHSMLPEEIE